MSIAGAVGSIGELGDWRRSELGRRCAGGRWRSWLLITGVRAGVSGASLPVSSRFVSFRFDRRYVGCLREAIVKHESSWPRRRMQLRGFARRVVGASSPFVLVVAFANSSEPEPAGSERIVWILPTRQARQERQSDERVSFAPGKQCPHDAPSRSSVVGSPDPEGTTRGTTLLSPAKRGTKHWLR